MPSEIFDVTTRIDKKDKVSLATLQEKVVDTKREYDRNAGNDKEIIISNADGIKAIPLSEFADINLLRLEATWAESDNSIPIVEGKPAPFEFRPNGGAWVTAEVLHIEGKSNFANLDVRNPHTSGKKIKIRSIVGANS